MSLVQSTFVKLSTPSGDSVSVSVGSVVAVRELSYDSSKHGRSYVYAGGEGFLVVESVAEVFDLMRTAVRGVSEGSVEASSRDGGVIAREGATEPFYGAPVSVDPMAVAEVFRPGSGDWDWSQELEDVKGLGNGFEELVEDVQLNGVKEPVLLGADGRVWDGHHRILAAIACDLETIPVVFSGGGND